MTQQNPDVRVSSYLRYLPAIFQQDADERGVSFLGRFLLAFEQVLSGTGNSAVPGIAETIEQLYTFFSPDCAPTDFLPWLASWVALTLREDWEEQKRRRFLANIVPLYQRRGTAASLKQILEIYTGMEVEIYELISPLQIGFSSTIGKDTAIGGGPPHYFVVRMILNAVDPAFERRLQIARALIEQEKPAHTYYDLQVIFPTIQVGITSHVGKDTLIGRLATTG
jgi:phage tail-like protein